MVIIMVVNASQSGFSRSSPIFEYGNERADSPLACLKVGSRNRNAATFKAQPVATSALADILYFNVFLFWL
jgi:hypothetical protein